MKLSTEKTYHITGGIICGLLYLVLQKTGLMNKAMLYVGIAIKDDSMKDLMGAIINICAILIGFLTTAKAIMLSLNDRTIARLKELDRYNLIIRYLMTSIKWIIATAFISSMFLIFDAGKNPPSWCQYFISLWITVMSSAFLSFYRVANLFYFILSSGK